MMLKYDPDFVHAYLMCGLLEDIEVTDEQKDELSIVNDLIEALRKEYAILCTKHNATSTTDLMNKTKVDEVVNQDVNKWLNDTYRVKNNNIKRLVQFFNEKHVKGFAEHTQSQKPTV